MFKNKNKNTYVLKNFSRLKGLKKLAGLMGKEKSEIVIFKTRFGIHTFFLKFPIDLVIVSKNKKVIFIKKSVKPNRIVLWNFRYDTVIELPEGSIEKLGINIGSILKI
ncbi:MAG: DUF192 domain-containing protein [Patescibacteria group bacterium]